MMAVLLTFTLRRLFLPGFPVYAVDDDVTAFMEETTLRPLLEYLMREAVEEGVAAVVAVPGPGERRPITREDVHVNQLPF